ncbi:MAG: hypothetical protein HZA77_14870 [Candidatus Schekmanbacteria bacterium]|nr:hypothetical protein [Candidatus Schekmanbacteria bacterium]
MDSFTESYLLYRPVAADQFKVAGCVEFGIFSYGVAALTGACRHTCYFSIHFHHVNKGG